MTRLGHKDQESNGLSNSHHLPMLVRDFKKHLSYVTQMHILAYKGPKMHLQSMNIKTYLCLEPIKISTKTIHSMVYIVLVSLFI